MIKFKIYLGYLFLLGFVIIVGCDKTYLSNNSVSKIIENEWNDSVVLFPARGDYDVVSRGGNIKNRTISKKDYEGTVALSKMGLIKIIIDRNYDRYMKGKGFSWGYFMEQLDRNVIKKITLIPTEKGEKYIISENNNILSIPMGKFKVTKVLENKKKEKGVEIYRLIMIKYDVIWSEIYRDYCKLIKKDLSEKRKAIVLLKWDSFESIWQMIVYDIADDNEEFRTNHVGKYLSS